MQDSITFTVNGTAVTINREDRRTLLTLLRDELGLTGAKNGCGVGECGTCTVLVDSRAQRACRVSIAGLNASVIETVESLAAGEVLHPIQQALLVSGAIQCGFCTPGMLMAIKNLLDDNRDPTESEIRRALRANLCRCTGYEAIVDGVKRAARALAGDPEALQPPASAPVPRLEGRAKATGALRYAGDLIRPGTLHGALVFSEHSHAELLGVDTSACAAAPGVQAVHTAADLPGRNGFGLQVPHQPVFAYDRVRYLGEVVACIVAETAAAARAAREKLAVRYRPLAAQRDPAANMQPGADALHPGGNIAEHVAFTRGDPERAFAEADLVVEGEYRVPPVEHAYLEPESCLAVPEEDGYAVTVYAATQGSFAFREMIAASLNLPPQQVRVIQTMPGGGFGGKEEPTVHIQAALAALQTGRPVKMTLTREESIRISTKRHGAVLHMSHALRADGTIIGFRSRSVCDAGAYLSLTKPVVFRTVVCAAGPYTIPNVSAEGYGVYTTTNPAGAFRGFGSTQVAFASERQMDKIARRLGVDPFALRRKNGLAPGRRTITGQPVQTDSSAYLKTLETVERALAEEREELMCAPLEPGWRREIGVASSYKNVGLGKGLPDSAGAEVELLPEGRLVVRVGATDMGQGSDTIMAQIAARAFGAHYKCVTVISSDTAQCPDGGMTTASRQTFITGNAVRLAAAQLAARLRGTPPNSKTIHADTSSACERSYPVLGPTELGMLAAGNGPTAGGEGNGAPGLRERVTYTPPATTPLTAHDGPDAGGDIHFAFCYTTHAVVLAVHPESGRVRVERVIAAADAGRAVHLQNVHGQIEGGVIMGLGYALSEEFRHEGDRIVTNSLAKLGIPRTDTSPSIRSEVIEVAHAGGPYGAKGLGEIPLNPVAPAVANALAAALGVELDTLPITPERIITALG